MHRDVITLVGILGALLVACASYAIAAIRGYTPMSLPIFFGMMLVLVMVNTVLLIVAWRRREESSVLTNVALIIWGVVASWYWTFGSIYYVLTMNLNSHQLAWTAFAFLWEVPVIGGGVLVTLGVILFRPINRAVTAGSAQPNPLLAYRQAVQYPWRISLLLFILSVIGYLIGAGQIWQFAGVSRFEIVKSISNGPIVAVFLAVIYYVTLDTYLDKYRRQLSRRVLDRSSQLRSLRRRLAVINIAVMVGGIGLLGLLLVQSGQRLQENRLAVTIREDLAQLREVDVVDDQSLRSLSYGPRGVVRRVAAAEIDHLVVSPETREALRQPEGVVRDLHEEGKMIGFVERENGDRLITVAYLTDFYDFLLPGGLIVYGLGIVFVILITMAVFLFVSYEITRALVSLRLFAQKPSVAQWGQLTGVHTGDEIESVGRAFLHYVQKAEEVDETKREFVSIASHQLRTPLTAIQWYVELLLSGRDGELNKKQIHDLKRIARGNRRMVLLVNDLLNISRIDSGRLSVRPEKIDLAAYMQQLIDEILPQAAQNECEVVLKKERDKVEALVDPALLRQVLHNLLTNAIKYRDPKRRCLVNVGLKQRSSGEIELTVADTGVGIPLHEQRRVFDKFWRANNVATLDTEGTGLGLYVSKMLLEAAGARISFISQEGEGTTFQVIIPARGMLARPGEVGLSSADTIE